MTKEDALQLFRDALKAFVENRTPENRDALLKAGENLAAFTDPTVPQNMYQDHESSTDTYTTGFLEIDDEELRNLCEAMHHSFLQQPEVE